MTAIAALPPPVEKFVRRFVARRLALALLAAFGWALAAGVAVGVLSCVSDRLVALPAGVRLTMAALDAILVPVIALRSLWGRIRLGRGRAALSASWVAAARLRNCKTGDSPSVVMRPARDYDFMRGLDLPA